MPNEAEFDRSAQTNWQGWPELTPLNSEIICGQNLGTKVVCGKNFFFEKKGMLKI